MRNLQIPPREVYLTKKRTVAWIQSFLETVGGQKVVRDPARPALLWGKESVGTQQRWGNMRRSGEEVTCSIHYVTIVFFLSGE
jgi:hypothetical protein